MTGVQKRALHKIPFGKEKCAYEIGEQYQTLQKLSELGYLIPEKAYSFYPKVCIKFKRIKK